MPVAREKPIVFNSNGNALLGVFHFPKNPVLTGVIIVVGGAQYRAGSHRQFVLLSRFLATNGFAVFRFDYHGMGDSEGELSTFENCELDIKSAVDTFFSNYPSLESVVLWGLCDGATASVFYADQDARVKGLVLLNPWVRSDVGEAKAYLKNYYLSRLMSPSMWRKVVRGGFDFKHSTLSFVGNLKKMLISGKVKRQTDTLSLTQEVKLLPDRLFDGLVSFNLPVLIILSGNDMTANEFRNLIVSSVYWKKLISHERFNQFVVDEANHTFAKKEWRELVERKTLNWLNELKQ